MKGLVRVDLKPMSVNQMWFGAKRPTKIFQQYRIDMDELIPEEYKVIKGEELFVFFRFGFSTRASDLDNGVKPFLDGLQAKLGFNDNKVVFMCLDKDIVPKKQEYIEFLIKNRKDVRIEVVDLETQEIIYEG